MPIEFYAYLLMGAAAGGLINRLAGFGTSLFALGFWLQILEPLQAVSIVVVMSVVSSLQGVWLVRHSVFARISAISSSLSLTRSYIGQSNIGPS
jgi:hypothetical protein